MRLEGEGRAYDLQIGEGGKGAANQHRGRGLALGEWGKCADQSRDGSWRSGSEEEDTAPVFPWAHGRERVTAGRSEVSGIRILLPASSPPVSRIWNMEFWIRSLDLELAVVVRVRGDIFALKDKGKCGLPAFLQIGFMR